MVSPRHLFAALLLSLAGCERNHSGKAAPEGGVVIGADVPGTKVFYRDRSLGTVPVSLDAKELADLGLPAWDGKTAILESDGWAEGLFLGREDQEEYKIHFLAPDPSSYLVAQTPWGPRTKTGGRTGGLNRTEVKLFRRDAVPMAVTLEPAERTPEGLAVRVTAVAGALQSISGHRPELYFLWGGMDTPWRKRTSHVVKLPAEWASFNSRQSRSIVVTLPVKESPEGLSLFCVFNLFKAPEGDTLAVGSIYGDSVWIAPGNP